MLKVLKKVNATSNPFFQDKRALLLPFMYMQHAQKHYSMLNRIRRAIIVRTPKTVLGFQQAKSGH